MLSPRVLSKESYLSRRPLVRKNKPGPWERAGHELRVRKRYAHRQFAGRGFMPTKTASRHHGNVELLHVHALSNCKKNPGEYRGLRPLDRPSHVALSGRQDAARF